MLLNAFHTVFHSFFSYKPQMILMKHISCANGQTGHTPELSKPGSFCGKASMHVFRERGLENETWTLMLFLLHPPSFW